MPKAAIVVGTRPEIIKMSPIMRALEEFYIIHTGQHYDYSMDRVFFEQLQLPEPKYKLDVGSGYPGIQLSKIIERVEGVLIRNRPDVILVLGDSIIGDTTLVFMNSSGEIRLMTIEEFAELFFNGQSCDMFNRQYKLVNDWKVLSVTDDGLACFKDVKQIIRHKTDKNIYMVRTYESEVYVTEDHSICTLGDNKIICEKPVDIKKHLMLNDMSNLGIKDIGKISLIKDKYVYPKYWKYIYLHIPNTIDISKRAVSENVKVFNKRYTDEWRPSPDYAKKYNRVKITEAYKLGLSPEELSTCFISNAYLSYGYQVNPYVSISPDLCWVLGFYLAEGSFGRKPDNTCQVILHNQKMNILNDIKGKLDSIFGMELPSPTYRNSVNCGHLALPLVLAFIFIEGFDVGFNINKKVPSVVYHSILECKKALFDGYMTGDGYITTKERSFCTKSKTLFDSLLFLLRSMNIRYTIVFNKYRGRKNKIYHAYLPKFGEHRRHRGIGGYYEKKLRDVSDVETTLVKAVSMGGMVYDLTVDNTERFVSAHGVVLHNTSSVLGGALSASKLGIKVGHIEAGLRSWDRTMPEEINRILVDHCSDFLFAPTAQANSNLLAEGIPAKSIEVVGNTIVDAVNQNLELATKDIELGHKAYALMTVHRQENVDNPQRFGDIMKGVNMVSKKLNLVCLYPIHPRAEKMMKQYGISQGDVVLMPPRDYFSFLCLEKNAKIILTDSGGIQEEACMMNVPCVTLRDNTERPETVNVGANRISGTLPQDILECATEALNSKRKWDNPYGDGHSGERIVKILEERLGW